MLLSIYKGMMHDDATKYIFSIIEKIIKEGYKIFIMKNNDLEKYNTSREWVI